MLFRWVRVAFVFKQREGADEFWPRLRGLDYLINKASLGRDIRIRELALEFRNLRVAH